MNVSTACHLIIKKLKETVPAFLEKHKWILTVLKIVFYLACLVMFTALVVITCISLWFPKTSLNQLIFHMAYLDAKDLLAFKSFAAGGLLVIFAAMYLIYKKPVWGCVLLLLWSFQIGLLKPVKVNTTYLSFFKELHLLLQSTQIYTQLRTPQITPVQSPKNLIVIFVESLENNFANPLFGENLLPGLTKLAQENTTFRGYEAINGTGWTIGSQVATFCGIPLRVQLAHNLGMKTRQFLPNAVCLSDILQQHGYYNVFLKGCYLSFFGTDIFINEHHFDETWGRDELLENGYATKKEIDLPWFGLNDTAVFRFARQKITELSKRQQPFFISITTLDMHVPYGLVTPDCPPRVYNDARDVIKCTDKKIYDFVRWCQKQPFYKNTRILIMGDHLMMSGSDLDKFLQKQSRRETYNVLIDPQRKPQVIERPFSQIDYAATLLDILGLCSDCHFGLGASLLRPEPTWIEQIGPKKLNEEFLKNSPQYNYMLGIAAAPPDFPA